MKRFHARLIVTGLFIACTTYGQTDFYQQVSQLWFSGQKQAVLDIANQRLTQNPNDIAGLLLKYEYHGELLQLDDMTQTMSHVLAVGGAYSGTNFAKVFPVLQASYEVLKAVVTNYPPAELAADQAKTNVTGKTMSCDSAIKTLQDDGYFQ